ncbi:hypothetical protein ACFFX0_03250 [Citricoccus parietis]|uniref:Uncharacterized protein n=1 Tax=Citricoccus parietis TaxID=592307 RepID=A0ABV5FVF4_9MICC
MRNSPPLADGLHHDPVGMVHAAAEVPVSAQVRTPVGRLRVAPPRAESRRDRGQFVREEFCMRFHGKHGAKRSVHRPVSSHPGG